MKFALLFQATSVALCFLGVTFSVGAVDAPAYPQKPITIMVGFPPGGLTDVLARRLAKDLQTELKQTVIVENKAGASGQIATAQVSKATADGYTLLVTATHHVINPAINPRLPYDTAKDFVAIAELASTPNVLVVHPSLAVSNLQDYLSYARKQQGGLAYGSSSIAGSTHLSGEMLALMTKAPLLHVPYKGLAPATSDLLGGQIPSLFSDLQSIMPFIKDGKVRPIGVTSPARSSSLPNVPTIAEQGVPGFEVTTFIGLYGPADLPKPIVDRLNKLAVQSMTKPESVEWLKINGGSPGKKNATEFATFVNSELVKWRRVVVDANVKAE